MNEYWNKVIDLAIKASKKNEVPVGAIVVYNNKIIAKSYNKKEKKHDVMGHAEIKAIKKASHKLKTWKLDDCVLYVSLKPCTMCENIIRQSRIKQVYYLIDKPENKKEFYNIKLEKYDNESLEEKYKKILNTFFNKMRK